MVEWSITTVLKTVVPRGTGGSNPSLSAIFYGEFHSVSAMQKYPRGRRGSPAKGVGCDKRREGSNPSFSAKNKTPVIGVLFLYLHIWRVTEAVITGRS